MLHHAKTCKVILFTPNSCSSIMPLPICHTFGGYWHRPSHYTARYILIELFTAYDIALSFLLKAHFLLSVSPSEGKGRPGQSYQARVVSLVMSCQGYKEGCSFFLCISLPPKQELQTRESKSGSSICGEHTLGILVSLMQFKKHVNGVALPDCRLEDWRDQNFRCFLVNESWVLRNSEGPVSSTDLIYQPLMRKKIHSPISLCCFGLADVFPFDYVITNCLFYHALQLGSKQHTCSPVICGARRLQLKMKFNYCGHHSCCHSLLVSHIHTIIMISCATNYV